MKKSRSKRPISMILLTGTLLLFLAAGLFFALGRWTKETGRYVVRESGAPVLLTGTELFQQRLDEWAGCFRSTNTCPMLAYPMFTDPMLSFDTVFSESKTIVSGDRVGMNYENRVSESVGRDLCFQRLREENDTPSVTAALAFLESFETVDTLLADGERFGLNAVLSPIAEKNLPVRNPLDDLRLYSMNRLTREQAGLFPVATYLTPVCFRAGVLLLLCTCGVFCGRDFVSLWSDARGLIIDFFRRLWDRTEPVDPSCLQKNAMPIPLVIPVERTLNELDTIRLRR